MTTHHHGNRLRVKPWRPVWKSKQNARGQQLLKVNTEFYANIKLQEGNYETKEYTITGNDASFFLTAIILRARRNDTIFFAAS